MLFQREIATAEFCAEIAPLVEKHYKEIAHYQDIPLDPDYEQYVRLEEAGVLRVYTARAEHKLAGYCIFFVKNNLHYRGSIQAMQDIIYIDPAFRGAQFGAALINYCDFELKKEGVQVSYHHVKFAKNFGPLLEKLGYQAVDAIYGRRLDK